MARTSLTLHEFLEQKYRYEQRVRLRQEGVESSCVQLSVGVPAALHAGVGFIGSFVQARARERNPRGRTVFFVIALLPMTLLLRLLQKGGNQASAAAKDA